MVGIIALACIGFLVLAVIIYGVTIYNGLVQLKNNIEKAWGNIDVLLKQRHDEIPKLIKVVEGYVSHEQKIMERVTQAREAYAGAKSVGEKAKADSMMNQALRGLFAVAENYPDLKANTTFLQFQGRISDLENQIADRREFYNDSVNQLNIRIEQIPDVFVARFMGLVKKEMFKVSEEDRKDVDINFSFT